MILHILYYTTKENVTRLNFSSRTYYKIKFQKKLIINQKKKIGWDINLVAQASSLFCNIL